MKAPAFQLYAADFYMDTVGWSCEEVGLYFRLLMAEWVNGSIPNDIEKIARIGGCLENRQWRANVERMWSELCKKFVTLPDGNLVNLRLEETRAKQKLFIENQREKGKIRAEKRWDGHIATATKRLQPEDKPENGSSSSSSSSNNKKEIHKEKVEFCNSLFQNIPDELMSKWKVSCPAIDIKQEIARAEAWVISNPKLKKSNWSRFLTNWMMRAQDRARNNTGGITRNADRGNRNDDGGSWVPPEYKGDERPEVSEAERAANLAKIRSYTKGIGSD